MSRGRPTNNQMRSLVDLMANDPELCSGKFSKSFTHKIAQEKWKRIAVQLNALNGAEKNWEKWKKTWQDTRNTTKSKAAAIKRHLGGTGGGPQCPIELSDIQKEALPLLSQASISGHSNCLESIVEFTFDDTSKDVITESIDAETLCVEEFVVVMDCENHENAPLIANEAVISTVNETSNYERATSKPSNTFITSAHKPNNKRKITVAAKLDSSTAAANRLGDVAEKKCKIKESYYIKKIKLMEENNNTLKNIEKMISMYLNAKLQTKL